MRLKKMDWDCTVKDSPIDVYMDMEGAHDNLYWARPGKTPDTDHPMNGYKGPRWGISVKECNSIKSKWGEETLRGSVWVTITRNDEDFYSFVCGDIDFGWAKARSLLTKIQEFGPVNFNSRYFVEKEIEGRKVWWKGTPLVIDWYIPGQCCAIAHWDEERGPMIGKVPCDCGEFKVKLDLLEDGNIWWFDENYGY